MAQPFSPKQRDAIRERLKESARKYAVSTGVEKNLAGYADGGRGDFQILVL